MARIVGVDIPNEKRIVVALISERREERGATGQVEVDN